MKSPNKLYFWHFSKEKGSFLPFVVDDLTFTRTAAAGSDKSMIYHETRASGSPGSRLASSSPKQHFPFFLFTDASAPFLTASIYAQGP